MVLALAITLGLTVTLFLAAMVEQWLLPKPKSIIQRSWQSLLIATLTLVTLFFLYFAVTRRVGLTTVLTAALPLLLMIVSNAKYKHLHEPLVFSDWRYFWEAVRYPKLYLPYFGMWRAVFLLLAFIVLVSIWLMLETPFEPSQAVFLLGLIMAVAAWVLSIFILNHWPEARRKLNPVGDLYDWGGLCMHRVYRLRLNDSVVIKPAPFLNFNTSKSNQPDIVCIQAESFVDRRRWGALNTMMTQAFNKGNSEKKSKFAHYQLMLPNWDALIHKSVFNGTLSVPAWGANTQRTEFAVLTGLDEDTLGAHRFDPYRSLLMPEVLNCSTALPAWLTKQGYHTTFIHPYFATFYDRHKIMPRLGFNQFIDIQSFKHKQDSNAYVSDIAVGESILKQLNERSHNDAPTFIYAVTMQGHGPYQTEKHQKLSSIDHCQRVLHAYDQCLQATDHMLGELKRSLEHRQRKTILCVWGDHVPILTPIYEHFGQPDGLTDYLIWQNDTHDSETQQAMKQGARKQGDLNQHAANQNLVNRHCRADQLAQLLLDVCGFKTNGFKV